MVPIVHHTITIVGLPLTSPLQFWIDHLVCRIPLGGCQMNLTGKLPLSTENHVNKKKNQLWEPPVLQTCGLCALGPRVPRDFSCLDSTPKRLKMMSSRISSH